MTKLALRGDIIFTKDMDRFEVYEDSYILIKDSKVEDIKKNLDEKYKDYDIIDYKGKLIIPGFVDLHLHAAQFPNRGLGMDRELIPWLETYTFPEEAKYSNLEYAENVYKSLINELWAQGTTRSVVYSSIHKEGTELLLDLFIGSGLSAYVGKVNMNRNTPDYLREDTEVSLRNTKEIIMKYTNKNQLVRPIITPRFAPTCCEDLMLGLGALAKEYRLPVQTHLNENLDEINWVKELFPGSKNYASVYEDNKLIVESKTILAHCIHNTEEEMELFQDERIHIAHCPYSNLNLSSGIMPVREFLNRGIKVGLGTDMAGGHSSSIAKVMVGAIEVSKLVWLEDKSLEALKFSEAFYLATKGGGEFFGKVGSFETDYDFDCLVVDTSNLMTMKDLSPIERLEKFIYIGDDRNIHSRYVGGKKIEKPFV